MANSADPDQLVSSANLASSGLLQKPTDLDLHCLQRQGISGFSRKRVNIKYNTLYFLVLCLLLIVSFASQLT